jgi:hypothetical protein
MSAAAELCDFKVDPDKGKEENGLSVILQLFDKTEQIGAGTADGEPEPLVECIKDEAAATAESYERGQTEDKTVAVVGDSGDGKSSFINLLMYQSEVDESQYGFNPTFGAGEVRESRRRSQQPTAQDWENKVFAFDYLRSVATQEQLRKTRTRNAHRFNTEVQARVNETIREARENVIRPRNFEHDPRGEHMDPEVMRRETAQVDKILNAYQDYPENDDYDGHGIYEHLLKARNDGTSTSFIQIANRWGPIYCVLVRTKTVEELEAEIHAYPFRDMLAQHRSGQITSNRQKSAYEELVSQCAKLRVLSGEDYNEVRMDRTIKPDRLPSYTDVLICEEICMKAGRNIIIAGNGFRKDHDRVFVRNELDAFLTPSNGLIVQEVVTFSPCLLFKDVIVIDTPGTKDHNPINRAATTRAVEQADLLIVLTDRNLSTSEAPTFLKEVGYLSRMLRSPDTCKVLFVSLMSEKTRRLTAQKLVDQWDIPSTGICKARSEVSLNVNFFKSELESVYNDLTGGYQDDTEDENGYAEGDEIEYAIAVSGGQGLTQEEKEKLGSFENVWRKIEAQLRDRNLGCLPLLHVSLCFQRGGTLDAGIRDKALEMTGGAMVVQEILKMIDDKSGQRLYDLSQRLLKHVQETASGGQEENLLLPGYAKQICKIEGGKKWTGKGKDDKDTLMQQYDIKISRMIRDKVEPLLESLQEDLEHLLSTDVQVVERNVLKLINNKQPAKLVQIFAPSSNKTGLFNILFSHLYKSGKDEEILAKMDACYRELQELFVSSIADMLAETVCSKLEQGRTRNQMRESDQTLRHTIKDLVKKICQNEVEDEEDIPVIPRLVHLRQGIRKLDPAVSYSGRNLNVQNKLAELKSLALSCRPGFTHDGYSFGKMLREAKEFIESGGRHGLRNRLGQFMREEDRIKRLLEDAAKDIAYQVREDFFDRMKSVEYFFKDKIKLGSSTPKFLSVYGACFRELAKRCAENTEDEEMEDVNEQQLQRHRQLQEQLQELVQSFADTVKSSFFMSGGQSDLCDGQLQGLQFDIERQQLLRLIRRQAEGQLPRVEMQRQPFKVKVTDTFNRGCVKYRDDPERFYRVLNDMKTQPVQGGPDQIFSDDNNVVGLTLKYKFPSNANSGDSMFEAMLMTITKQQPSSEAVKTLRQCLVFHQIAQCSSKRGAEIFQRVSGGESPQSWGQRMQQNGVPGDALMLESFCNYYKLNALVFTKASSDGPLQFPAFRPQGATFGGLGSMAPLILFHMGGSVYAQATKGVRIAEREIVQHLPGGEYDERNRAEKRRSFEEVRRRCDQNALDAGLQRRGKKTRVGNTHSPSNGGVVGPLVAQQPPPGYIERISQTHQRPYYFNQSTNPSMRAHEASNKEQGPALR